MTNSEIHRFAELNEEAALIEGQNARYAEAGGNNRRFEHIPKNDVAVEQLEHLEFLSAMSDELPYEELGLEDIKLQKELDDCRTRLKSGEGASSIEKIAVSALANKLCAEFFPTSRSMQDAIEANARERMTVGIDNQHRAKLQRRIDDLQTAIGELSIIFEVAGQPWPLPKAHLIENPTKEHPLPKISRNGNQPNTNVEISDTDIMPETPNENSRDNVMRLEEFRKRHIDEPHASQFITFYLKENTGRNVTVDELVAFLYSHVEEERNAMTLRSRITSSIGPKVNGKRIIKMLEEYDLTLQYGWRPKTIVNSIGKRQKIWQRLYRAIPTVEVGEGESPEFIEDEEQPTPTPIEVLAA